MEYFVDEYETLFGRNLSEDELEYLQGLFDKMYLTKDIYKIYSQMLCEYGYESLPDTLREKRKVSYEDVYPMLYLKYRLSGQTSRREIRHLIIDEMQDYSYLQYTILNQMFSCRMTILGDRAQSLDDEEQDVLTFLPKIFGMKMKKIVINRSYRNTLEIGKFSAKLLGLKDILFLERHGKDVEEQTFHGIDGLLSAALENLSQSYETAAILTMTEEDAHDLYRLVKARHGEKKMPVHYIDRNSTAFEKGLTVTTYYLAKGLEFDQVFTAFPDKKHPFLQQASYISATRALHELYIYRFERF